MIGYLSGVILDYSPGNVLVGVGESGARVGYSVCVPCLSAYDAWGVGSRIELFVHTHVREDALDLYGFASRAEKELFLTLLTVNGIGPKGAMNFLSKAETEQLVQAILEEDKATLVQIPGIGKKTAERVVLELADPLRKKVAAGILSLPGTKASARLADSSKRSNPSLTLKSGKTASPLVRDACDALLGLGYREGDALQLIERVLESMDQPPLKVEELIRGALRYAV